MSTRTSNPSLVSMRKLTASLPQEDQPDQCPFNCNTSTRRKCIKLTASLPQDDQPDQCPSNTSTDTHTRARRKYITCCVRLSAEKEPYRFVDLMACMHASGTLDRLGLVPLLCGSSQSEYALAVKADYRARVPTGCLEESFLGALELGAIYAQTRLNFHPCRYDAFGMTLVEAASQGAPSLAHSVRAAECIVFLFFCFFPSRKACGL